MKPNFKTVSLLVGGLILLGVAIAWIWTLRTSGHQNGWHAGVVQQAKPEIVKADFYLSKIQPVFSARCIACHSCMNSPCQLDLTSYEGLQRGASKVDPYNFPLLETNATTRIGIDAHTEEGWRKKGFHSVLDGNEKSILAQFLDPKNFKAATDVKPAQSFHAESSRMCPSSEPAQLKAYFDSNPQGEMPFGFPAIESNSREVISKWISEGARGPSAEAVEAMSLPSTEKGKKIVADWETYLNRQSFKERLVARYIYEHLFIAHVHFDGMPGEFFRLIRARNETGTPDEIATRRPYDDPGKEKFYYRFKKFTQELVAKTHLPYELGEKRRERYEELFFKTKWEEGPDTFPVYGPEASNAFMVYKRIPAESRYRFLLDDAYYHIGNFIKGPVCRGQTALNVINDQFWVMFIDPSKDPSARDPKVISEAAKRMKPPAESTDKLKLFTGFRDGYWESLHVKYAAYKDQKDLIFDSKMIWDGDKKNPNAILTVYRHFDSAEVLLGAHGPVPDTVWVMDYQVLEDVYYNLVAGYDLFSPTIHQLNTRLYMEISRIASEDMFLNFLPSDDRANLRAFWNRDTPNKKKPLGQKIIELFGKDVEEKMAFEYPYLGTALKSSEVKAENPVAAKAAFLSKLFNEHFTKEVRGPLSDVQGLKVERNPGFSLFAKDDKDFLELEKLAVKPAEFAAPFGDVAFVRVREGSNAGRAYTIVHNKAHSSVSMLLFEDERREPWRDTLNIVSGFASSYPNMYFDVDHKDLSKFVERVKSVRTEAEYKKLVAEYGVERTSAKFWSLHDWFNEETKRVNPLSAGAFDLNRYAN